MLDKKVKIIATIGPSSQSSEMIQALAEKGTDIFRINLSHATENQLSSVVSNVRLAETKLNKHLSVLVDLPGPKIRIGSVIDGASLKIGDTLKIHYKDIQGTESDTSLNYPSILKNIAPGTIMYIDDGNIKLLAEENNNEYVRATVLVGGPLISYKGFSAEGISYTKNGVSENDKKSIELLLKYDVDAIAISFTQSAADVTDIKNLLPSNSTKLLIAKIETEAGVENAEEILKVADGLMVARGDLGLSVPFATVPNIQKQLIKLCNKKAKPVITATQMLESMINKPLPTRAEVTDVANAIIDGTDAVMLSAETTIGKYPLESVDTLVKIILETLKHSLFSEENADIELGNAVSHAAGIIADQINSKLIIAFTQSGVTAQRIAKYRHKQPIIAASQELSTLRNLNFSWGVYPFQISKTEGFSDLRKQALEIVTKNEFVTVEKNDTYVIAAGMPFGQSGTTNMIFIDKV